MLREQAGEKLGNLQGQTRGRASKSDQRVRQTYFLDSKNIFNYRLIESVKSFLLDDHKSISEPEQQVNVEKARGEYWYSLKEYEKSSQSFGKCLGKN